MTRILAQHAPHLAFVLVGIGAFLWAAYRKPAGGERRTSRAPATFASPAAGVAPAPRAAPAPLRVRPAVARRGLVALGPLLAAAATGAILYAISLGQRTASGAVIWAHAGISVLALVLVAYKLASLDLSRLRRGLARQRLGELVALALGVVSVPLLISGIALLTAPSSGSFAAYSHLISSVWWTGLLLWHLRRHIGASLRAVLHPAPSASRPLQQRRSR